MYQTQHIPYLLDFHFDAGTSRGILRQKETHFIKIWHTDQPEIFGIGETGLFRGLSADDHADFEINLHEALYALHTEGATILDRLRQSPSIAMGIEMALQDLQNGGKRILYPSRYTEGKQPIPINGLIWMGERDFMKKQIIEKVEQGFDCIKLKIGALDFDLECDLLGFIRKEFDQDIILRVDANGAFAPDRALEKLRKLTSYNLHSIEQPIRAGQWEEMAELCAKTPLPIALDEELIGVYDPQVKRRMLEIIRPQFIILKPSLLGGFAWSDEWIDIAQSLDIAWWVTSALESNIGLNAIAQWTAQLPYTGHQGLGTGGLYTNNIIAPMMVKNGLLHHQKSDEYWDLSLFE